MEYGINMVGKMENNIWTNYHNRIKYCKSQPTNTQAVIIHAIRNRWRTIHKFMEIEIRKIISIKTQKDIKKMGDPNPL